MAKTLSARWCWSVGAGAVELAGRLSDMHKPPTSTCSTAIFSSHP